MSASPTPAALDAGPVRLQRRVNQRLRVRLKAYPARFPVEHDEFATVPSRQARTADAADD